MKLYKPSSFDRSYARAVLSCFGITALMLAISVLISKVIYISFDEVFGVVLALFVSGLIILLLYLAFYPVKEK